MESNELRREFPYFVENADWIFLENAGGSQVPQSVIDRVTNYFSKSYVQLHAHYKQSDVASETVRLAHEFCLELMNGRDIGEVVLGSSTTQLIHTLGHVFEKIRTDETQDIIVTNLAHEANYGIWTQLKGFKVKEWQIHEKVDLNDLDKLLSNRTRLVALTHVSNLVGEVLDVETITQFVHQRCPRARVIVDGVAYAPHCAVDVRRWKVDFYIFSLYKVYGPHMSVLYGSNDAWKELIDHRVGPNHFFIPQSDVRYQYEIGCLNHEGCAAILGIQDYFQRLTRAPVDQPLRHTIEQAYDLFNKLEKPLVERLLTYLWSKSSVTVLGGQSLENRVPTVSFISSKISAETLVKHLHSISIACRNGHMYAYRLLDALKIDVNDGVVRLSAVHYNTEEEIDKCIKALDEILLSTPIKDNL